MKLKDLSDAISRAYDAEVEQLAAILNMQTDDRKVVASSKLEGMKMEMHVSAQIYEDALAFNKKRER